VGVAAPEVGAAYARACALCQQVGETPQIFRVLWGLLLVHSVQAQLATLGELSQQLFHLAQRQPDTGFLLEEHFAMGSMAFYRGDFIAARSDLEQSLRLADTLQSPTPTLRGGFVPGVIPLTYMALALWALGYTDQARQRSQEALALAQQSGHTPSLALAEFFATLLSQFRRDVAATQAHADALMTLAAAQGFALRFEQGRILRGWALAMRGDAGGGMAHLRQGVAESQGVGPELLRPYWLSLLAEAYGRAG
jgi:predicted ATPase